MQTHQSYDIDGDVVLEGVELACAKFNQIRLTSPHKATKLTFYVLAKWDVVLSVAPA